MRLCSRHYRPLESRLFQVQVGDLRSAKVRTVKYGLFIHYRAVEMTALKDGLGEVASRQVSICEIYPNQFLPSKSFIT